MKNVLEKQKKYYQSGMTRSIAFRIKQLETLKLGILKYEQDIIQALKLDLNKPEFEAYATEVGFVLDSIGYFIKHLEKWAKDQTVKTPIHQGLSKAVLKYEPFGVVLIIAPFNYPFQLLVEPLIGAMAAGNTAIVKPSEYTPHVEAVLMKLMDEFFEPEYIKCVTGGREITTELIHLPFDYIFFTGSVPVGKVVMKAAAENLVPVTLELGGKSPTIVHEDANIEVAAKRIAWGKFMNAGQICVAPDYVYVHEDIKEAFVKALQNVTLSFYGALPMNSPDYCRIVNDRHFERLTHLIDHSKVVMGGQYDAKTRYIAPTIMHDVTWDDAIMSDEIFGPILPLLTYNDLESVIETINSKPKPLAFYVFSENESVQDYLLDQISFGGGCVNDTISHVATPYMPFGGVGASGMGAYHGEASFKTFSHQKSIIKKSTKFDLKLLYPPYKNNVKWVRKIMK